MMLTLQGYRGFVRHRLPLHPGFGHIPMASSQSHLEIFSTAAHADNGDAGAAMACNHGNSVGMKSQGAAVRGKKGSNIGKLATTFGFAASLPAGAKLPSAAARPASRLYFCFFSTN